MQLLLSEATTQGIDGLARSAVRGEALVGVTEGRGGGAEHSLCCLCAPVRAGARAHVIWQASRSRLTPPPLLQQVKPVLLKLVRYEKEDGRHTYKLVRLGVAARVLHPL
jgi:hypothetical protein